MQYALDTTLAGSLASFFDKPTSFRQITEPVISTLLSFIPLGCHNLNVFQAARRVSNDKKPAQRKSSGANKGTATTAADAPRKSSSSAAAPRESTSIGAIGAAVVGEDGSVQDVEQRVADVFVAFASSVAKVGGVLRGQADGAVECPSVLSRKSSYREIGSTACIVW